MKINNMKKDISNYSIDEVKSFIDAIEAYYQMGEVIDLAKQAEWQVTEHLDWGFSIVLKWIKGITYAPKVSDPTLQQDDIETYELHQFQIMYTQSKQKLAKEVVASLEELNKESLIVEYK